jgi:hypothetical protein
MATRSISGAVQSALGAVATTFDTVSRIIETTGNSTQSLSDAVDVLNRNSTSWRKRSFIECDIADAEVTDQAIHDAAVKRAQRLATIDRLAGKTVDRDAEHTLYLAAVKHFEAIVTKT